MTENEQVQEIDDLLIGFDELGFRPTIPLPDPEATAVRWRNKLVNALKGYRKVERGEWIGTREAFAPHPYVYNCSVCGFKISHCAKMAYKFCANCGADMRGENGR